MSGVINLLTHGNQLITPKKENAVEYINALRSIIDNTNNETSSARALLDQTRTLLGDQRVAINAHAELTSFVLAEQMSNNLAAEVATLNTDIATNAGSVDSLRDKLLTTVGEGADAVEYIGGPNKLFTGIFKGCIDGTLYGSVFVRGEESAITFEGEAEGNTFVVNPEHKGQLDNVAIGAHVPLAGAFTALSANSLSVGGVDVATSLAAKATTDYVDSVVDSQAAKLAAKTVVTAAIDGETLGATNLTNNGDGTYTLEPACYDALTTALNVSDIASVNQKTLLVHDFIDDNQSFNNVYLLTEADGVVTATISIEWDRLPDADEVRSGTTLFVIVTQEVFVVTQESPSYAFSTIKSYSDDNLQTQIDTNIGDITSLKSAVNAILNLMGEQSVDTSNNEVVEEVHPQV